MMVWVLGWGHTSPQAECGSCGDYGTPHWTVRPSSEVKPDDKRWPPTTETKQDTS